MSRLCLNSIIFSLSIVSFSGEGIRGWIADGKPIIDLRFRLESVDQAGFDKEALASTLRGRIGYQTSMWGGLEVLIDFETIGVIGESLYNDTANGITNRPVVADREDSELNRLQLRYVFLEKHQIILGRQRIKLDNDRFIGNVGWRQNEQTYDALIWQWQASPQLVVRTGYLGNANRVFGQNHPTRSDIRMASWMVHGQYKVWAGHRLSVFGYFIDNENVPAASHRNIGFYDKGQWPAKGTHQVLWEASYVDQADYQDGSETIDASYFQAVLGWRLKAFRIKAGYEVLGGNGQTGFMTPFATGHAFNGWADQFLATPADGLKDLYLKVIYTNSVWKCHLALHQFKADQGGLNYGNEIDFVATRKLSKRSSVAFKVADYQADQYRGDITKIWCYSQWKW